MTPDGFRSNHAGGILGGISNGEAVVIRMALKPTSSIALEQDTIDIYGNPAKIATKGRHDPCVGIRAVPIAEAMMALVLVDFFLRNKLSRL
jgi:chorismate synthase